MTQAQTAQTEKPMHWSAAMRELAVRAHMRAVLDPLPPLPLDGASDTIRDAMALQDVPAFTLSDAVREHIIDQDTQIRRLRLLIEGDLRKAREELAAAIEAGDDCAEEAAEWRGRVGALEDLLEAMEPRKVAEK